MKIRTLKRRTMARMEFDRLGWFYPWELMNREQVRELINEVKGLEKRLAQVDIPEIEVESAKVEYVVARVSNGEVINTFDLREDALKLIKKHAAQKKAKLYLVPMPGIEPFTEEELAD